MLLEPAMRVTPTYRIGNPNFHGPVIVGKPDALVRLESLRTAGTRDLRERGPWSLRGPGLFNFDTSLFKNIRIGEELRLQFRTEAFNILNHPNFAYPNEVVSRVPSTAPREVSLPIPRRQRGRFSSR